jgi:hypothetical protein
MPTINADTKIHFPVSPDVSEAIVCGLAGLTDVEGGPTPEQGRIFHALATHLLGADPSWLSTATSISPKDLYARLPDHQYQRLFMQMAIVLDLCRHPRSEAQLQRLEAYAAALRFDGPQIATVREFAHLSATEATARFIRLYDSYMPELSEHYNSGIPGKPHQYDDEFFERVKRLAEMPYGSLGWAFSSFYTRSKLKAPGRDTPNPGYYVCHDMNHVITGYEATGPGEIALGAFKLALNNNDANWMASMTNFLIHEVGLFVHGSDLQFVPHGGDGDPYHVEGIRGALDMPGAPELFAEALERGSACLGDFSQLDHLAMAHIPLAEIRREYHILPLSRPMYDDKDFWPTSY